MTDFSTEQMAALQASASNLMAKDKVHLSQIRSYLPYLTGEGHEDPIADTLVGDICPVDEDALRAKVLNAQFTKDEREATAEALKDLKKSHIWLKGIAATALALKELRAAEAEAAEEQDAEEESGE